MTKIKKGLNQTKAGSGLVQVRTVPPFSRRGVFYPL
jgi:hypothetical protein